MLGCLRVLDVTGPLGWFAGRLLADLGAEVVKLGAGTADRSSAVWRALNINKFIAAGDAGPSDRERLAADADVLL